MKWTTTVMDRIKSAQWETSKYKFSPFFHRKFNGIPYPAVNLEWIKWVKRGHKLVREINARI